MDEAGGQEGGPRQLGGTRQLGGGTRHPAPLPGRLVRALLARRSSCGRRGDRSPPGPAARPALAPPARGARCAQYMDRAISTWSALRSRSRGSVRPRCRGRPRPETPSGVSAPRPAPPCVRAPSRPVPSDAGTPRTGDRPPPRRAPPRSGSPYRLRGPHRLPRLPPWSDRAPPGRIGGGRRRGAQALNPRTTPQHTSTAPPAAPDGEVRVRSEPGVAVSYHTRSTLHRPVRVMRRRCVVTMMGRWLREVENGGRRPVTRGVARRASRAPRRER